MDIIEKIMNIIYPPVCGFCNKINADFLCSSCARKFEELRIGNIDNYENVPVYFDEHYYMFKYENEVRDAILKYKFDEKSYMYKSFAQLFVKDNKLTNEIMSKYDCITSVPIHKKRLKQRGYNQSKLIARELAKICGKTYYDNIIIKSKNIVAQSSLDKMDRVRNIKDAFDKAKEAEAIKHKQVLIFDDVFTTGATANECAKILKKLGASKVGIITIAKS